MVPPRSDRITRVPPYSRISCCLPVRDSHPLRSSLPGRSGSSQLTTGLVRVRSPLLAESLLMSVPPGTEMFQFPGFASRPYEFGPRSPCGGVSPFGHPRINDCSHLPAAYRSVPRPSSPLGAKASTKCPLLLDILHFLTEPLAQPRIPRATPNPVGPGSARYSLNSHKTRRSCSIRTSPGQASSTYPLHDFKQRRP